MRILLTGATGFIGTALVQRWAVDPEIQVVAAVRRPGEKVPPPSRTIEVGDLDADTNWTAALAGVDVVVHAAARVHVMHDRVPNPLVEFRRVNTEATLHLAREAAAAGARRFLFISSIKVNGEQTEAGRPFRPDDTPAPLDPYGISKLEAELGLHQIARETGMECVVIRPTLVYGPGVRANFLTMMRWLDKGIPLPFGAVGNRRSLVALDNLVDLITLCLAHPAAANQIWLVSDDEDVSTSALLRRMARALDRSPRLIPVPQALLEAGARLLGRPGLAQRLFGNLQVDISKTRAQLGWTPPVTVDQALAQVAATFIAHRSNSSR